MSRQESNALRLRNCLFVLLLYIFAGSTVAQSSNAGIAPSGLEWEKSGRTLFSVTSNPLARLKEREYLHSIDEEGNVWIKTQGNAHIDPRRSETEGKVASELDYLCSVIFGTRLGSTTTEAKKRKLVGWWKYPKIIQGKCLTKSEYKERIERMYAEVKASREAAEAKRAEDKRIAEQRRVARADARRQRAAMILEERKEKCTSYGFIPNTDGHATCVMELAIADEANEQRQTYNAARATAIENQTAAAQAAADEARRQREAAADEARRQRQAQALINLGSAISSGGASGRSISTPTTAPLSSGRYKTCNYRVAGEIVPMTVGRAELCPARRSIGGRTGYLVR